MEEQLLQAFLQDQLQSVLTTEALLVCRAHTYNHVSPLFSAPHATCNVYSMCQGNLIALMSGTVYIRGSSQKGWING